MKTGSRIIRLYRTLLLMALCIFGVSEVCAQFSHAKIIDQRSGLSETQVRVIAKDSQGFVWIGTTRGLNRFDGSQIRQFLHDPDDPGSILDNQITALIIDSAQIWLGGLYGVSSLDLTNLSFENIQCDCDSVLHVIDLQHPVTPYVTYLHLLNGILWISTQECGLLRYDIQARTLRRISFKEHRTQVPDMVSSDALDRIYGFAVDRQQDSIFWIGTGAGLIRFNYQTSAHQLFYRKETNLLYQDAVNVFRRIVFHDDGNIYSMTWGYGVQVFDPHTNEFYPLPLPEDVIRPLRFGVADLRQFDAYNLWLRTVDGLHLYNTSLHRITQFYPNENPTANYGPVYFEDESRRRWFSTTDGIYLYDPLLEQFLVFSYKTLNNPDWNGFARKVVAHPDGSVVTILGQGADALYHYSHRENKWFETPVPGITAEHVLNGIDLETNEAYGWVFSAYDGIYNFDAEKFIVTEIDLNIDLDRELFTDLTWGHDGSLWIGTRHEGILRYSPAKKQTLQYNEEIYADQQTGGRHSAVNLFCDSRGNIWFKTENGHSVYSPQDSVCHNFNIDLTGGTMRAIARFIEDPGGQVWCISRHGNLARGYSSHPEAGLEVQCSVFENGIPASYVEGIVYGADHKMHVLCESALITIDSALGLSAFNFEYSEFLQDFFSFDSLSETSLVVGLRNSFAVLHSAGLKRNTERPIPYLTEVTINEKPLTGNFITPPPSLHLRHNENFISFSFSAISYTLPESNRFKYRLRGFDPEWVNAGSRRFANYTNIPAGDYMFELQVANNEGVWNKAVYQVPLSIAHPWWATWWFRIAAFIAVVSTAIMAYRFRIGQIRKEARLKSEFDRKIGDVELSALRAQMNPHFIFNCLNSIENYILKNESVKAAEYINDFARLIRLILQNSRSEYIPLKDEVEALDLYLQMESLRFDNKFEYSIDLAPEVEPSDTDIPPMLIQPFVENAIWHGLIPKDAPGKLSVNIARENGNLRCVIEDNGIGREKSREVNASMHKRGKKSMGMLITINRIDVFNELYQTNATVHIHDLKDASGKGTGTRVELIIPIG